MAAVMEPKLSAGMDAADYYGVKTAEDIMDGKVQNALRKGGDVMTETATNDKQVYLAQDIQNILRLGRSRCYTYLEKVYEEQKPFRVIKIGKLFRIPKQSFDNWLDGCGQQ